MPKEVKLLPNMRVDLPDFEDQTTVYNRESFKLNLERWILDNYPAVANGFRVEISNQVTSPGEFTIHNGVAFDRDGQLVNNEEDIAATRSATLPSDATYYVEIEYITNDSDQDARGFWDPRYDNGSDTSGDVLPDGREFSENVSTRKTPDWSIVTPISTSGFSLASNLNTLRIPVAVLTVTGGQITGGTTSPLQTVIIDREGATLPASSTSVKLVDTRAMPDSFTLRIDPGGANQEDVGVTSNDRENGILTISATANAHAAGTRVIVTGGSAANFLSERNDASLPSSGTEDARQMLWRGNEDSGYVLGVDPTGTGDERSDVSIHTLKRYIDFMAGQFREMKFGPGHSNNLGTVAPPTSFSASPRYFDVAGGILGSRTNTISIGNGLTSWGDFNTTQYANDVACIQAAIDALPATGGIIFLKRGTYTVTSTAIDPAGKSVIFAGEGAGNIDDVFVGGSTIIEFTGAVAAFTLTSGSYIFQNLRIVDNGSSIGYGISIDLDEVELTIVNSFVEGIGNDYGDLNKIHAENSYLGATGGPQANETFINCTWDDGTVHTNATHIPTIANNVTMDGGDLTMNGGDLNMNSAGNVVLSSTSDLKHGQRELKVDCYQGMVGYTTGTAWVMGNPVTGGVVSGANGHFVMGIPLRTGDRLLSIQMLFSHAAAGTLTFTVYRRTLTGNTALASLDASSLITGGGTYIGATITSINHTLVAGSSSGNVYFVNCFSDTTSNDIVIGMNVYYDRP